MLEEARCCAFLEAGPDWTNEAGRRPKAQDTRLSPNARCSVPKHYRKTRRRSRKDYGRLREEAGRRRKITGRSRKTTEDYGKKPEDYGRLREEAGRLREEAGRSRKTTQEAGKITEDYGKKPEDDGRLRGEEEAGRPRKKPDGGEGGGDDSLDEAKIRAKEQFYNTALKHKQDYTYKSIHKTRRQRRRIQIVLMLQILHSSCQGEHALALRHVSWGCLHVQSVIHSARRFLLLGQGDFIESLMDAAQEDRTTKCHQADVFASRKSTQRNVLVYEGAPRQFGAETHVEGQCDVRDLESSTRHKSGIPPEPLPLSISVRIPICRLQISGRS